ncbi:MAG: hypothetical protein R6V58_18285 [Planctomycetota bacterium]
MQGPHAIVRWLCPPLLVLMLPGVGLSADDPYAGLRVKRAPVFEFTQKPAVTRAGDRITIRFAVKAFCDATVAIENAEGRIARHLASGVLGRNAPPPFEKNAKRQTLVWDGKDDKGVYVDDKASHRVRVSLGLNARFERTLLWSPYKRLDFAARVTPPLLRPAPEGVYVFDGGGAGQGDLRGRPAGARPHGQPGDR